MAKKVDPKPDPGRLALAEELLGMILRPKGDPGNVVSDLYVRLQAEVDPPAAPNAAVEGDEAA